MKRRFFVGGQVLHISNWVVRPWQVRQAHVIVPICLRKAGLNPLLSLRMLKFCSIEGLTTFSGWRDFDRALKALQREAGLVCVQMRSTLIPRDFCDRLVGGKRSVWGNLFDLGEQST